MKSAFFVLCIAGFFTGCTKDVSTPLPGYSAPTNPHIDSIIGTYTGNYRHKFEYKQYDSDYNLINNNAQDITYSSSVVVSYIETNTSAIKFSVAITYNDTADLYYLTYQDGHKYAVGVSGTTTIDFYPEKDSINFHHERGNSKPGSSVYELKTGSWTK